MCLNQPIPFDDSWSSSMLRSYKLHLTFGKWHWIEIQICIVNIYDKNLEDSIRIQTNKIIIKGHKKMILQCKSRFLKIYTWYQPIIDASFIPIYIKKSFGTINGYVNIITWDMPFNRGLIWNAKLVPIVNLLFVHCIYSPEVNPSF